MGNSRLLVALMSKGHFAKLFTRTLLVGGSANLVARWGKRCNISELIDGNCVVLFVIMHALAWILIRAPILQRVHCGCIVSAPSYLLLDAGGIECIVCAKKELSMVSEPNWICLKLLWVICAFPATYPLLGFARTIFFFLSNFLICLAFRRVDNTSWCYL